MFLNFAKFELNYFRKQPSFYVSGLVFLLLPFFAMISDNIQIGGASNVNFNSPHAITQTLLVMSIVGMFLVANFVGGTAVRDHSFKMDGIMLSMPVGKSSYLWGRLCGAVLVCLLLFLTVPLGTLIGSFWPTIDAERLGDTQFLPYLWSYIIFVLPNFLFTATLFYIFALKTRTMMGMYLGVVAFYILYSVAQQLLNDPQLAGIAALMDPFGISAFAEATRYWTPFERNTQLITLEGDLLLNRILWLAITLVMMVVTHVLMDIRAPQKQKKQKTKKEDKKPPLKRPDSITISTNLASHWQRFWVRTGFEVGQIVKGAPFKILCVLAAFILTSILFNSGGLFGTPNWPLTRYMAEYIGSSFALMMLIIITYYSAETVWRERQLGMGDIVESTPIRNWSIYFPKLIGLVLVLTSMMLVGIAFTTIYQAVKSHTDFEWGVYFGILSLQFLIPMVLTTILAVFIQVLSPNKYAGMLIFVVYIIASLVMSQLGLEHGMWQFAETPSLVYSDINQYGHYLDAILWYNLYWFGFTLMLIALGFGLWPRGSEYNLKYRFKIVRTQMGGFGSLSLLVGLSLFIGSGSYIYYNTRVLNTFMTQDEQLDLQAEYEKKYQQYAEMDLPTITDVVADVDFYPEQRKVVAKGYYELVNRNEQPIDKVLLNWTGAKNRSFRYTLEGGQEIEKDDKFYHAWIKMDPPLQPGASTRLQFELQRNNKGFVDSGSDTQIVENGSFINSFELFPHLGYNPNYQIQDRHERRKRGLEPVQRLPKLEDSSHYGTNFIGKEADFINFKTTVSTSKEQIAIAPGYLQKEWVDGERRYFEYQMDSPIFNFVAYLSGTFEVSRDEHKGIAIEIYHHPDHDKNIDRMVDSVKASLDYFGEQFSPYQHRQVRIIEFPRYARFAQSFPNTIPYSEDIGFIADLRGEDAVDYVYFVTAHEMAHQWWGHQITPANVQGSAVLSETLSEYSAYMVMEKQLGKHHLRQFLKWEMDRYLRGRNNEVIEEMPLYRAENQQYIHYQKGGVVMYALRDRLGEEVVNTALRKFIETYQFAYDPYPTTLDLLKYIKAEAPAAEHDFIDDMFKRITLYDLKLKSATAQKLEDGRYQLEIVVDAAKYYADGQGEETEAELAERFDIGVFSKDPDEHKGEEHVLHLQKHAIKQGENTLKITVSELPEYAGIDPYITMIDRNSGDNLKKVELK